MDKIGDKWNIQIELSSREYRYKFLANGILKLKASNR